MESPSTRSIWWKGALKGALKGLPLGLAMGIGGALLIWGIATALPALGLATAFSGFLFETTAAGTIAGLKLIPFTAFNIAFSTLGGLFTGGSQAVAAAQQQHLNIANVEMIRELDGRTRALEEFIAPSAGVKKIIAAGPRAQTSYRDAEEQRTAQPAPESPTIH
jgi:hypothetical protein